MSGIPETISADLARFFYRKLVIAKPATEFVRSEPEGYHSTRDGKTCRTVLRHLATGIRVAADPLDLVERVDRRCTQEATKIVYLYLSEAKGHKAAFTEIATKANTRPREAWKLMVEHGLLAPIEGSEVNDADGLKWYTGAVTNMDPAHVLRRIEHRVMARIDEPWYGADYCIAFHLPARCIKPIGVGNLEVLQLQEPVSIAESIGDHIEVEYGVQLIEAAMHRDAPDVQRCLDAQADPNFVDTKGWTALHAAASQRICFDVLDILFAVSDVTARNKHGDLPVDIADKYGQADIAAILREKMRGDPKGKHLVM